MFSNKNGFYTAGWKMHNFQTSFILYISQTLHFGPKQQVSGCLKSSTLLTRSSQCAPPTPPPSPASYSPPAAAPSRPPKRSLKQADSRPGSLGKVRWRDGMWGVVGAPTWGGLQAQVYQADYPAGHSAKFLETERIYGHLFWTGTRSGSSFAWIRQKSITNHD